MSSILAQKLISVNLNKGEFEKIKWLRYINMECKFKAIGSLKEILKKQISIKTCRICLKPGNKHIFDGNQDFDIVGNLRYILGIEVVENDGKPQHICIQCENSLRNAVELKQVAEITQWRLQQELEMVADTSRECEEQQKNYYGGHFVEKEAKIIRMWTCGKCRRHFDSQVDFDEHEQLPSCRRRAQGYICENCGREFKTITRLKRHRVVHTGELAHACPRCPHRARSAYALALHAVSHGGARAARCALCAAAFVSASHLATHMRRHRPPAFPCHLCARAFRLKESLRNHIATRHSTEKPHICNICGKAYSTRKMVCHHERRVHNRPKLRSRIRYT